MPDIIARRLTTNAEWEPEHRPTRTVEIDNEQLHGRTCVRCGSPLEGLVDAGYVYTRGSDGGRLGWPVKACVRCAGEEAAA